MLTSQTLTIALSRITSLEAKLTSVSEELSALRCPPQDSVESLSPDVRLSHSNGISTSTAHPTHWSTSTKHSVSGHESSDGKYSIVVSGIAERPHGTSWVVRTRLDFDSISCQLTGLTGDDRFSTSIWDCRCLGKYNQSSSHPRPILVTLNSTVAVSSVLLLCSSLNSPVSIRPDLTPSDRLSRGLLLRERQSLLDASTDRNSIKIRGSGLYVSDRLVGKVKNGVYVANQSLGDFAPHLVPLTPSTSDDHCFLSPW